MPGKMEIMDQMAANVEGLSKKQAGEAFDAFVESVTNYLSDGERVQVPGLGSFSVSHRAARKGRNPATGESIDIAASNNVKFKPGKDLKGAVNS